MPALTWTLSALIVGSALIYDLGFKPVTEHFLRCSAPQKTARRRQIEGTTAMNDPQRFVALLLSLITVMLVLQTHKFPNKEVRYALSFLPGLYAILVYPCLLGLNSLPRFAHWLATGLFVLGLGFPLQQLRAVLQDPGYHAKLKVENPELHRFWNTLLTARHQNRCRRVESCSEERLIVSSSRWIPKPEKPCGRCV